MDVNTEKVPLVIFVLSSYQLFFPLHSWKSFYFFVSRYEPQVDGIDESRRKEEVKKINSELLKKLQEFDTEITFSTGRYQYFLKNKVSVH